MQGTPSRQDVLKRLAEINRLKQSKLAAIERTKRQFGIYFYKPLASSCRDNPYQKEITEPFHRGKRINIVPSPNKMGKTVGAVATVASWTFGFEPWNRLPEGHPEAVEHNGGFFRRSSLGHMPNPSNPIAIRITGEDWEHHMNKVVVPELKKWIPAGMYETRKNHMGVEAFWEIKTGATLELMTHSQDDDLFEAWYGHAWWSDEPPKQSIYGAMSRGLMLSKGKTLMTMTPLKEAWVLDDLILSGRPEINVVQDVMLWDNPLLYDHDYKVLQDAGLSHKEIVEFFNRQIRWAWGDAPARECPSIDPEYAYAPFV